MRTLTQVERLEARMGKIEEVCKENRTSTERKITQGLIAIKEKTLKAATNIIQTNIDGVAETIGLNLEKFRITVDQKVEGVRKMEVKTNQLHEFIA